MRVALLTLLLLLLRTAEGRSLFMMKYKASSPLASKWYKDKQRTLTKKQKQILSIDGPSYIIPLKFNETIALPANTELDIEIGCGTGDFLVNLCKNNLIGVSHVIGCDIHR